MERPKLAVRVDQGRQPLIAVQATDKHQNHVTGADTEFIASTGPSRCLGRPKVGGIDPGTGTGADHCDPPLGDQMALRHRRTEAPADDDDVGRQSAGQPFEQAKQKTGGEACGFEPEPPDEVDATRHSGDEGSNESEQRSLRRTGVDDIRSAPPHNFDRGPQGPEVVERARVTTE